jgi:hypothetical protein
MTGGYLWKSLSNVVYLALTVPVAVGGEKDKFCFQFFA